MVKNVKSGLDKSEFYAPLIQKIDYWIDYDKNLPPVNQHQARRQYRAAHDRDCVLTGGNLLADTIFSVWCPLKMVLKCLNPSGEFYKYNRFDGDRYKFLREIRENCENLLPSDDSLAALLLKFIRLTDGHENVMILPNAAMQKRGIDFCDQMPRTLYECFKGGAYSQYFSAELPASKWVRDQKLAMLFYDKEITRENIIPLTSQMTAAESGFLFDRGEITEMLQYCISALETRKEQLK